MRKLTISLLLVLAAGVTAGAVEENTGPLSETKQQLRQFQKDQANQPSGTATNTLKGALPGISAPAGLAQEPPAPLPAPEALKEKTAAPPTNWLLDGYDKLDPKSSKSRAGQGDLRAGGGSDLEGASNPYDPNYLLSAYQKQTAAQTIPGAGINRKAARDFDPMAPFMKNWLANSPIRQAILSTMAGPDDLRGLGGSRSADGTLVPDDGSNRTEANRQFGRGTFNLGKPIGQPAENPYLQTLNLGVPAEAKLAPLSQSPLLQTGTIATDTDGASASATEKRAGFKAPATPADDDKKYFKQLKRF